MLFGYARVSSRDQNLGVQIDTLTKAGCDRIFEEKISGAVTDRPELNKLSALLRPGDIVVVTHLDRLGRDSNHMMALVSHWRQQGVHFRSLDLGIDTNTLAGELVLKIFAALSEYNRGLIKEKQRDGQALAKAQGKHTGRPAGVNLTQLGKVKTAMQAGMGVADIVKLTGISMTTVKRYRKLILDL